MVEYPTVQAVLSELARRTGTAIATVSYCYYKQREGKKPAKGSTGERLLAWLSAQGLSWKDVADCRFLSADDPGVTVDAASPADAGASSARPDPPRPDSDPSLPAAPAACGAPMADHLEDLLARIRNVLPRGAKIIIEL